MKKTNNSIQKFREYVIWAIDRLGLYDWSIKLCEKQHKEAYGTASIVLDAKMAVISYNKKLHEEPTEIKDTAYHECLEVMLAEFQNICENKHKYKNDQHYNNLVQATKHGIIQRLTRLLKYIDILENQDRSKKKSLNA